LYEIEARGFQIPPPLPHHVNASRPSPGFPLGTYGSATDRHLRLQRYLLQLIPLGQAPLSSPPRRIRKSSIHHPSLISLGCEGEWKREGCSGDGRWLKPQHQKALLALISD
ncbi:hypothetical protein LINPERPRIM_LOCUS18964, partial [Linum perenne]